LLDVKRATLVGRLAGRRVCPKCGTVYNVQSLPPGQNYCDRHEDKPELFQRPDDKEDVIGKRLEVYEAQTRPLIEHYSKLGLLRTIAGEGELDKVFARMEAAALGKQPTPKAKPKAKAVATAKAEVARPVTKQAPVQKKAAVQKLASKKTVAKQPPQKAIPKKPAKKATKAAQKTLRTKGSPKSKTKSKSKVAAKKAPKKPARKK
jgi:adenylate kinase